jgi:hypothetical protein
MAGTAVLDICALTPVSHTPSWFDDRILFAFLTAIYYIVISGGK